MRGCFTFQRRWLQERFVHRWVVFSIHAGLSGFFFCVALLPIFLMGCAPSLTTSLDAQGHFGAGNLPSSKDAERPPALSKEDSSSVDDKDEPTDEPAASKVPDSSLAGSPGSRLARPESKRQAMRPAESSVFFEEMFDDLPLPPLLDAVEKEIDFLERSKRHQTFTFGERVLPKAEYLQGLRLFLQLGRQSQTQKEFLSQVKQAFDFYEVYGPADGDWGQAKITAYYEPILQGSSKKTKKFSQALYLRPSDLVRAKVRLKTPEVIRYVSRARYVKRKKRWVLTPYYSRRQIDQKAVLKGRHLELCFVDPLDAYFLHIEGSGTVIVDGKKTLRVRPSDQNGHPFYGYGRDLVLQANQKGWTVEQYLRSLPQKKMFSILNENPSYVFFEINDDGANTSLGMPATAGRTIATDARLFPKGALGLLLAKKPVFAGEEDLRPTDWMPFSRFVLDQDTGGSIEGGGRVDLFWGEGKDAKRHADVIHQQGRLYYLVPKKEGWNQDPVARSQGTETAALSH